MLSTFIVIVTKKIFFSLKIGSDCFFIPPNNILKTKKKYEVHGLVDLAWNAPRIFTERLFDITLVISLSVLTHKILRILRVKIQKPLIWECYMMFGIISSIDSPKLLNYMISIFFISIKFLLTKISESLLWYEIVKN